MLGHYGRHRKTTTWFPLIPTGRALIPMPPPEKVYHDRSSRCIGCPYPAHGLMCHNNSLDGSCLRSDIQKLEAKHQSEYLRREQPAPNSRPESLSILDMAFVGAGG